MSTEYSLEEIGKHNKESDCWVIIDGSVCYESNHEFIFVLIRCITLPISYQITQVARRR